MNPVEIIDPPGEASVVPLSERLALRVDEAGPLLGISRDLAYDLVARRELPSVRRREWNVTWGSSRRSRKVRKAPVTRSGRYGVPASRSWDQT